MAIRKGEYQDFVKLQAGQYKSRSGKTIIENAALFHDDESSGWWVYVKGEAVDVLRTLKEALSFKWD